MAATVRVPTISVVVPSYNHGRFLRTTLASALEQTLPPDELVVVDDGSTDDSPEILRALDAPGLRFELQENRGAHEALNRAIALGHGDYVAILNSDDLFEPERLEHAWGVARTTGALLVCGEVTLIGDDGGPPPPGHDIVRWYEAARALGREAPSLSTALRTHNVAVTTSNFFLHRALWQHLGGFRAWRYVHDYDFILRAVALCPGRVVYEPSLRDVRYRVHGSNTISEAHERALAERAEMLRTVRSPGARIRAAVRRVTEASTLRWAVGSVGVPAPVRALHDPAARPSSVDDHPDGGDPDGPGGPTHPEERLTVGLVARALDLGGLEEVVALLAHGLLGQGLAVRVYCIDAGGAVADRLAAAGIPVTVGDGSAEHCVAWAGESAIDVVSGHHLPVLVAAALSTHGRPVVETLHNTFAWYGPSEWAEERERAEYLAGSIAVSETVAAYYHQRTGYRPPSVIPNGVHPGRVTAVPRAFARRWLGLSERGPVFVSVGRLAPQKNLPGLLGAFARVHRAHPEARLLLAGPRDPGVTLSSLRAGHPEVFSSGAVRWLETRHDIGTVLSAADAFVSASFYEGWSVAASEAAWVGLPLLLSDVGGAVELVGADVGERPPAGPRSGPRGRVVVNPCGDPLSVDDAAIATREAEVRGEHEVELGEAMGAVAADLDGWRARRGEIRAWARSALAPDVMAARYAGLLRDVAARHRGVSD